MLQRFKIDSITYNEILERYPKYIEYVDDISKYFIGYKNKRVIKVDTITSTLIIQAYRLGNNNPLKDKDDWKQIVCTLDDSVDQIGELRTMPYATQANKKIKDILHKYYTDQDIEDTLDAYSFHPVKPLHMLIPSMYLDDRIHRFRGCVYYDINGAHTDALCEMFPEAKADLTKLHHEGGKDYINIFVGDLCNNNHRATYNWIVNRTRKRLEKLKQEVGGLILYANTDGIILWRPKKRISTSDKIGEFKSESVNGLVYTYYCKGNLTTTPYTIYQYYHPTKGKQIKGNLRLKLRKDIDLDKGIVVKAKIFKDANSIERYEYLRTEEIPIHEEN